MPNNSREIEKLNTEEHLRKEFDMEFKIEKLITAVDKLSQQMVEFEKQMQPMQVYFDRGSFLAKSILFVLKWSTTTVITLGGMAGAWIALKSFLHVQN